MDGYDDDDDDKGYNCRLHIHLYCIYCLPFRFFTLYSIIEEHSPATHQECAYACDMQMGVSPFSH